MFAALDLASGQMYHLGRVRPPQQHRHRQQHMRDQALPAAGPPRPPHPVDPVHPTRPRPPPRAQHTRATRAVNLTGRQPRLDSNRIRLYRHQRCLRASARPSRDGPPRHEAGGPLSCSPARFFRYRHSDDADHHRYKHDKINPSSATDLTSPGPVVGVRNDGQQPASNRTVTVRAIEIYRLSGGKIAEYWGEYDTFDLFGPPPGMGDAGVERSSSPDKASLRDPRVPVGARISVHVMRPADTRAGARRGGHAFYLVLSVGARPGSWA